MKSTKPICPKRFAISIPEQCQTRKQVCSVSRCCSAISIIAAQHYVHNNQKGKLGLGWSCSKLGVQSGAKHIHLSRLNWKIADFLEGFYCC